MSIIAIIPARGGSKRIPGKNIKPFAGKPMIAHSILAAHEASVFDRIMVSTDSEEIASVARKYAAEVPFMRPAELANDVAGTDAVIVHALQWLTDHGKPASYFCCIYATAPFLTAEYLRQGLELLRTKQAATAFSVATYPYPIFRSLKLNDHDRIEMFLPENLATRSQDLPDAFHDAGQFYWGDTEKYLVEKRLFSSNAVPVFLPRHLVQDIDTPEDWEVAERIYEASHA